MRIKIELSDRLFSKLNRRANKKGITVNALVVKSIRVAIGKAEGIPFRRPVRVPVIESKKPGSLYLDNAKIYELTDFP